MYFPTAFVLAAAAAGAAVPFFLIGPSAVAAGPVAERTPAEQAQYHREANNINSGGIGLLTGTLLGGGVVGGTAKYLLVKKDDDLRQAMTAAEREIQALNVEKDGQSADHAQATAILRKKVARLEEELADVEHQMVLNEMDRQRGRVGEILRRNVALWECMFPFLKEHEAIINEWSIISFWNEAAEVCDAGKRFPGLRVTTTTQAISFRLPDSLWLPDKQKYTEFALQPFHTHGLVQSFVRQAQRSLRPLTNHAFAASVMKKASVLEKEAVRKFAPVEGFR
ncbi:MAG: hypothetical protein M1826_002776 [Phylliscum demangeonii]|nr:MAG: hypothetical protein M1826_002776 [Phylliscum demangeonii]